MLIFGVYIMSNKANKSVCIDWLSITYKNLSLKSVIKFYGFDNIDFEELNGRYGYTKRLFFDGINIYFGGNLAMGVCCELSGQGCRNFEHIGTGDYYELFSYVLANTSECNITRLDIAYDDFDGILNFDTLIDYISNKNYVSRFREFHIEKTYSHDVNLENCTIYCGSRQSETLFRIYDKRAEQSQFDLVHWLRFEMQLRRDRAMTFVNLLMSGNDISSLFLRVINNYLRFVEPNVNDCNRSRAVVADWWFVFLQTMDKVSLCKCDDDYTQTRLEKYVRQQTSGAIVAFIALVGFTEFRNLITNKSTVKLNEKYMLLLKKHGIDNLNELFENEWWLSSDETN